MGRDQEAEQSVMHRDIQYSHRLKKKKNPDYYYGNKLTVLHLNIERFYMGFIYTKFPGINY